MREYVAAVPVAELSGNFAEPPQRFGPVGFWFLNDRCDPAELTRQLEEFAAAGFGGISPCARIGLDPEVGYLTEAWFAVMDHVMAECRRLGLQVILYDEASYPSGSANGLVVEANPEHMARGLVLGDSVVVVDGSIAGTDPATAAAKQVWTGSPKTTWQRDSSGPTPDRVTGDDVEFWRPTTGRSLVDRLVAVVAGELDEADRVRVGTVRLLGVGEHNLVRLTAAEFPGRWRLMAVFDVPSGGRIRGAYGHNDDGSPLAPAAANLLDPAAVASFLRLTHDAYHEHLGQWFGDPIVGMFTDEPHVLGRSHRLDARPWTPQLVDDLAAAVAASDEHRVDDALVLLPSLFVAYDDDHGFADLFDRTVADRLSRVYYGAQRRWCDNHGIALTGHPSAPNELTALDNFTWPGQDIVWRWVLPGETALHGHESGTARSAASVARQRGVRTVLTEVLGAYGWRLSLDEVKWLLDWNLVRGTTTFLLHALFASVRDNRAYESEPDLGLHNAWWPHFPAVARFLQRTTMTFGSLDPVAEVAVLVTDDAAPTDEVAVLYRHQVGFDYVSPAQLRQARGRYRAVVGTRAVAATPEWEAARSSGLAMHVLPGPGDEHGDEHGDPWWEDYAPTAIRVAAGERAELRLGRWQAAYRRTAWWFAVNEGEGPLLLEIPADAEVWDPWTGHQWQSSGTVLLERRGSLIIAPAGSSAPLPVRPSPAELPGGARGLTGWQVSRADGRTWAGPQLGDWTGTEELETFAGSVRYRTVVSLRELPTAPVPLDLGVVGELARVEVNGVAVAELLWAPYRTEIDPALLHLGDNVIQVLVTNSSANAFEGALRPSGLIGPIVLG